MILLLVAISIYHAWVNSRTEADPDWAMFNLAAFTGSWYGRDFIDCKSPLIHIWYWIIAKIVGLNVSRVRFAHTILVSLPGIIIGYHNFWLGLAFIVLINSGFLLAFHGNVGQQAAGLILLALWLHDPWVSTLLIFIAIAFEPKILMALIAPMANGWWLPLGTFILLAGLLALILKVWYPDIFDYLWEANITIPGRMHENRTILINEFMPGHTANVYVYILPWVGLGIIANPELLYWLPVIAYLGLLHYGLAVRPNHLIPIIPWIVTSGLSWQTILILFLVDFWAAGFYNGDLFQRFYIGLSKDNVEAREVGTWLKDKPGTLWVNAYHTAVYIHARKGIIHGLNEQLEIREVAHERREEWRRRIKLAMPDWIVLGRLPGYAFTPSGYSVVAESKNMTIYRKNKKVV